MRLLGSAPVIVIIAVIAAAVAGAFSTSAEAQGKYCSPWPGCKDQGSGDPPGLSTCDTEYTGMPGTCTDLVGGDCDLVRPNDGDYGWIFTEDCQTKATLIIPPDDRVLIGNGHSLELVGPWMGGRAAITNSGASARVADLNIHVESDLVANGCYPGGVEAAVSLDPHLGTWQIGPRMGAANLHITVGGSAQFCNVIEYASETGEDELPMNVGGVSGNTIGPESYAGFGIFVTNINATDNITGDYDVVGIGDNRVQFSSDGCVGIQVGPWVERAKIEDNDVTAPGGDGCVPVGIRVLATGVANDGASPPPDAFETPIPANVVGNTVDIRGDPAVGIHIEDSAIGRNEGNSIIGDPGDYPYDIINSGEVSFPNKGKKKNTCNGSPISNESESCP